ncbi:hypothetical protein AGMMS50225_05180 [Betaproteobacteria bacterium]|nr:hypothetical protein AGMMS50225_05180 [Betaproteobacteria bacterium]
MAVVSSMENISSPKLDDGWEAQASRADGVAAATKLLVSHLRNHKPMTELVEQIPEMLKEYLDMLLQLCPDDESHETRMRWAAAARVGMREIVEVLDDIDTLIPGVIPAAVLARAGAEAVRWNLVDHQASDPALWNWLGKLFEQAHSDRDVRVTGESHSVAREYLRALAYHSAALDEQGLKAGFATARLIELALPLLMLVHGNTHAALYAIDARHRGIPVRLARPGGGDDWRFVAIAAADMLADVHGQLIHGQRPPALEDMDPGVLRAAAAHLRKLWSLCPPVRKFNRHTVGDIRLSVISGYEQVMELLREGTGEAMPAGAGAWRVADLSRGGAGALTVCSTAATAPGNGEIVAFCLEEGTKWHLGVVRRVRHSKRFVEIGIASLSTHPTPGEVDDGSAQHEFCFCDPVQHGGTVRLVGKTGSFNGKEILYAQRDGHVFKLHPLAQTLNGKGFDLRTYQVL